MVEKDLAQEAQGMSKSQNKEKTRSVAFPTDGLIPAVAGIMCAMGKESRFTSAQLSKFLQHIHGSLLSAEFAQLVDLEAKRKTYLDAEGRAGLAANSFKTHGQSLKNLVEHWKKVKYIQEVSGKGRQAIYSVNEAGLHHFMKQVLLCEAGLQELRMDYLLLSLYTIRSTPLSIVHEAYPSLNPKWGDASGFELSWDWKEARNRFVRLLEQRRTIIEEYSKTNDQLPEIISKAKKAAAGVGVAGVIGALTAGPIGLSLPLIGYFAYRSQRDRSWGKSLRVLANMYESFRPSYAQHDMDEGIKQRSATLYDPMLAILGEAISTLEGLK